MKRLVYGLVGILLGYSFNFAAVSEKINYQGRLEESGQLVTGNKTMEFRIYDALTAGNQLWTSGQRTVSVKRGLFNYILGKDVAFPSNLFETSPLYLEVIVAGTTLSPREEIIGSPYAITAKSVPSLAETGTINLSTNPVDWTKFKNVPASVVAGGSGTDAECRLSTGTIRTDLDQVKIDTGTLRTDLNTDINNLTAVKVDTGTLDTNKFSKNADINNNAYRVLASTIGDTNTKFYGDGSSLTGTSAVDTAVRLDTGTLRTDLNAVTVSTGTLLPKAGGTMTGALNMGVQNITNANNIAATTFSGDGSALTGITDAACRTSTGTLRNETITSTATLVSVDNSILASTGTLVKKAGDTMTGTLTMGTGGSIAMGDQNITNAGTVEANTLQDNDDNNIVINDTCTVQGFVVVNGTVCINAATPPTSVLNLYVVGVSSFNGNVNIAGTLTAASKSFVQDHPTDPTKKIVYVCLEGGEAGTYVRGSAKLEKGISVVKLPEYFSLVTNENGLTVQITLREECTGVYVADASAKEIVIKELNGGKSNARFDYLVQGIRLGYESHQPIQDK